MWKVLTAVNSESFPLASVIFLTISAVLTKRMYSQELSKGLIREPSYRVVFPGRPCRLRLAALCDCTTGHLCLQQLKPAVRPVASEGPQTPQPPCAAVISRPGCLLTPCGQNVPCEVTGAVEAGGPGPPGCYNTAVFPDLQPFLKPCLLGASLV